ncbi:MAG: M67 family metallopeptidase [Thermoanaerobaculia bacterium]|nr:M67 family metallopeptidase [Thermoanaerobaculia bacterium]
MSATVARGPASRLRLPAGLARRVRRHALSAYPEECCGILIGRPHDAGARVTRVVPAANVWGGERDRRYSIDPRQLLATHVEARAEGLEVVGYYHSHPDAPAVPSRLDLERAWPATSYLLASVRRRGEVELRSWRLDGSGSRFVEEGVEAVG